MSKYKSQAKELIKVYKDGSDLTEEESHVLEDTALEYCQILDNVVHTQWFTKALAENLKALDCF